MTVAASRRIPPDASIPEKRVKGSISTSIGTRSDFNPAVLPGAGGFCMETPVDSEDLLSDTSYMSAEYHHRATRGHLLTPRQHRPATIDPSCYPPLQCESSRRSISPRLSRPPCKIKAPT